MAESEGLTRRHRQLQPIDKASESNAKTRRLNHQELFADWQSRLQLSCKSPITPLARPPEARDPTTTEPSQPDRRFVSSPDPVYVV